MTGPARSRRIPALHLAHRYSIDESYDFAPKTIANKVPPKTDAMQKTPALLCLPYELHEKIALCLDSVTDTLSLANSCFLLRSTLVGSNYIWYRLLNLAGSIDHEYDVYHPERRYYDRVIKIRQGKRLRCQICLGRDGVRTVDCLRDSKRWKYTYPVMGNRMYGKQGFAEGFDEAKAAVFFGVYCGECLEKTFYDIASFQSMQDKFWDGIVNPPIVRVPRWLVCKALSTQYTQKHTQYTVRTRNGLFSTDQTLISAILRSDARALMDATTDDEATDEVMNVIETRNEKLAEFGRRTKAQEKEYVFDYMLEAYEDYYERFHHDVPVGKFKEWWKKEVLQLPGETKGGEEFDYERSSRDPVRQLLRSYGRRSTDFKISRWADMLHDIGPGFKTIMKENMKPHA